MEQLFSLGNLAALTGWVALVAALFLRPVRGTAFVYSGLILPAAYGVAYVYLLTHAGDTGGNFNSIAGVRALFSDDNALTGGWFHYLAFDLFVGTWIARDGLERGAWRLALVPILGLTFMYGPAGFLSYLVLRQIFWRSGAAA